MKSWAVVVHLELAVVAPDKDAALYWIQEAMRTCNVLHADVIDWCLPNDPDEIPE